MLFWFIDIIMTVDTGRPHQRVIALIYRGHVDSCCNVFGVHTKRPKSQDARVCIAQDLLQVIIVVIHALVFCYVHSHTLLKYICVIQYTC